MPNSYYYCTGPVTVWAAFDPSASVPVYLGTCEQHPVEEVTNNWMPVFNDIGGPMTPSDRQWAGQVPMLICDLNKFNYSNIIRLQAQPNCGTDGVAAGTESRLARGRFLVANNSGCAIWLAYTYYNTINAMPGMPPGKYYPYCALAGCFEDKQGTQAKRIRLVFEAQAEYDPSTGAQHTWTYNDAQLPTLAATVPG